MVGSDVFVVEMRPRLMHRVLSLALWGPSVASGGEGRRGPRGGASEERRRATGAVTRAPSLRETSENRGEKRSSDANRRDGEADGEEDEKKTEKETEKKTEKKTEKETEKETEKDTEKKTLVDVEEERARSEPDLREAGEQHVDLVRRRLVADREPGRGERRGDGRASALLLLLLRRGAARAAAAASAAAGVGGARLAECTRRRRPAASATGRPSSRAEEGAAM